MILPCAIETDCAAEPPPKTKNFQTNPSSPPPGDEEPREKLASIYSQRQAADVPVRIRYSVDDRGGCRIVSLLEVRELE